MNQKLIEADLVEAGVRNLQEFGYPNCDKKNIFTDRIYKAFFQSMLQDSKGKAGYSADKAIDALIAKLAEKPVDTESSGGGRNDLPKD